MTGIDPEMLAAALVTLIIIGLITVAGSGPDGWA